VRIELPGVVQRFPAGHRLAVVLAASDTGYRGQRAPDRRHRHDHGGPPGVLELPVLGAAAGPRGATPATGRRLLPRSRPRRRVSCPRRAAVGPASRWPP
jgi:hypothetical protein